MKLFTTVFILAVTGGISAGQSVSVKGLQGLGATSHHSFESQSLDKRLHVLVGLPDGYDESGDMKYPTLYILDGGELYPMLKSYSRYLRNGGEAPDLILVAISYGTSDWQKGNDRSHDYTAPSDEREFWGGAADFQTFLSDELIPFIEERYRSRSDRRVVFGQSLGGQFVLYTAQTRPGLFWGHIASNPALHRNLSLFLSMRPRSAATQSHLFVGSGTHDAPTYREPALLWIEHWTKQAQPPWHLRVETLEGHNHFSAPPASFRQGIRWLFADYLAAAEQESS